MLNILPTEPSRVASLAFYAGIHTKTGHIVFREIVDFYGTKQK